MVFSIVKKLLLLSEPMTCLSLDFLEQKSIPKEKDCREMVQWLAHFETKHYFHGFLRPLNLVINLGTTMQKGWNDEFSLFGVHQNELGMTYVYNPEFITMMISVMNSG